MAGLLSSFYAIYPPSQIISGPEPMSTGKAGITRDVLMSGLQLSYKVALAADE
jgi:hypothetical protein